MHVVERGSGVPLVLLHGLGADHRLLWPLDPTVEAAGGWRRLYFDLPGHGRSPIGEASGTEDVAVAVAAEVRDRLGDEPFAVLGNSFGGMIARRLAHDFGEQVLGLATIAAVFVADHDERTVPRRVVLSADASVLGELGDVAPEYAEVAVVQSRHGARAFAEYAHPGMAVADQAAVERIAGDYALAAEPEDTHPPFTRPALFVTGRQDHVVGYRDAWARIEHYPRATFVVLDTAGHNVHLDHSSTVATLLADWLDRVAAARLERGAADAP